jgi:hypothetical protein
MNPSFFRIRITKDKAMRRLMAWSQKSELTSPVEVDILHAVDLACNDQGQWRGCALFVYENKEWTVFEDLTGCFSALSSEDWLRFAQEDDFLFAGYNDAIEYGELIVIQDGKVLREFLQDRQSPQDNRNKGHLPLEDAQLLQSWIQVASLVDEDDIVGARKGWLWLFEQAA